MLEAQQKEKKGQCLVAFESEGEEAWSQEVSRPPTAESNKHVISDALCGHTLRRAWDGASNGDARVTHSPRSTSVPFHCKPAWIFADRSATLLSRNHRS